MDIVSEFERACDSMGLKINQGKSKVLTIKKDQMRSCEKVRVNGEELQEVDKSNYSGVMMSKDVRMGEEVAHRVLERRKVWGTMAMRDVEAHLHALQTMILQLQLQICESEECHLEELNKCLEIMFES